MKEVGAKQVTREGISESNLAKVAKEENAYGTD
jgi:hypothetical protein